MLDYIYFAFDDGELSHHFRCWEITCVLWKYYNVFSGIK